MQILIDVFKYGALVLLGAAVWIGYKETAYRAYCKRLSHGAHIRIERA